MNDDQIEKQMAIHVISPMLLTKGLKDYLEKGALKRVINVNSSLAFRTKRVSSNSFYSAQGYAYDDQYSKSKWAQDYSMTLLAKRWEPTGITINMVHPGFVRTAIFDRGCLPSWMEFIFKWGVFTLLAFIPFDASYAACALLWTALSKDVRGATGKFFFDFQELPHPQSVQRQMVMDKGLMSFIEESASV